VSGELLNVVRELKISKFNLHNCRMGVCGSVVGRGTMLQAGRSRDRVLMRWIFSIDLILPATYGPGVNSASNRNEYQESSWGVGEGQLAHRADNLTAICELSRKCVSLDLSQPYGPSRPVYLFNCRTIDY
jgi:hypothetical protein